MSQEVEEIKTKINLAELIGQYVKLIPAGGNFRAHCPFHNEKTPSFMISPSKQIWKCFGCGAGGDAFTFLMKIEGLEFGEALRILAQKTGVKLSGRQSADSGRKTRLIEITELAAKYWRKVFLDSPVAEPARKYLESRGISKESAEVFQLGYAVDSWDNLLSFFVKRDYRPEEVFQAGLLVEKNRGSGFYDRFRGRLMFPISDLAGRIVGFGGRTLKTEETAKYINTPQTLIYNKSLILYGLYQAKEAIKERDACILAEGYLDVIPSHQIGVKNIVSISGTSLTPEQVKIIKRYSSNLILALDMDLAGRQAASRSIEIALAEELNVKVVKLSQGKDPGECVQESPNLWQKAITEAESIMEYFFGQAFSRYDSGQPENKKIIAKILLKDIAKLGNRIEQDYWLKELARRLEISEAIIRESFQEQVPDGSLKSDSNKTSEEPAAEPPSRNEAIFIRMLAAVLAAPEYFSKIVDDFSPDFWGKDSLKILYKNLILFYTKNNSLFQNFSGRQEDFDLFNLLAGWFKENQAEVSPEQAEKILQEAFFLAEKEFKELELKDLRKEIDNLSRMLKSDYLNQEITRLNYQLKQAEAKGDKQEIDKICAKLNDLISQKQF